MTYLLLLLVVLLTSASQILQKLGAVGIGDPLRTPGQRLRALLSLQVALACLAGGMVLWLIVLSRMELSRAYPFLSLGTAVVVMASSRVLHEPVGGRHWMGVLLICTGIALVAAS